MRPCRLLEPATKARASTRLVLPLPPWPTTATFLIADVPYSFIGYPGWSAHETGVEYYPLSSWSVKSTWPWREGRPFSRPSRDVALMSRSCTKLVPHGRTSPGGGFPPGGGGGTQLSGGGPAPGA